MTEAPVPEPGPVWSALSALHGQTGLVPILAPGRPGEDLEAAAFGEMAMVGDVDQVDVAAILEDRWIGSFPELWQTGPERAEDWEWAEDTTAPFTSGYPGLAPAVDATLAPDVLDGVVRSFPTSRIALVPADRPADVLPLLGWYPGNWDCAFPAPSPVALAAVMRSWEERFGARLFALTQIRPTCSSSARHRTWTPRCRWPRSTSCSATNPPGGSRYGRPPRRLSARPSGISGGTDSSSGRGHPDRFKLDQRV
jgi:hypothetical protein